MATDIGRRVAALESKASLGQDSIEVIIRTFVSPTTGPVESEPRALISLTHGWRIERAEDESKEAFIARATKEAPRTGGGVTRLLEELQ
jgi:hypothetical protein